MYFVRSLHPLVLLSPAPPSSVRSSSPSVFPYTAIRPLNPLTLPPSTVCSLPLFVPPICRLTFPFLYPIHSFTLYYSSQYTFNCFSILLSLSYLVHTLGFLRMLGVNSIQKYKVNDGRKTPKSERWQTFNSFSSSGFFLDSNES